MFSLKKKTAAFLFLLTAPLYVLFRNLGDWRQSLKKKKASASTTTTKADPVPTKRDSAIDLDGDEAPPLLTLSLPTVNLSISKIKPHVLFIDVPIVHSTYGQGEPF